MALAITIALSVGPALVASAHEGATGVVRERMQAMDAVGDAMKAISAMFRGQTEYDAETIREAADMIADHGGEQLTRLFPEGSLDHPTEALPAIWQDWDEFESLARDLSVVAGALSATASNPAPGDGEASNSTLHSASPASSGEGTFMEGIHSPGATATAEQLDALPPATLFVRLGQVCRTCHTRFRKSQ